MAKKVEDNVLRVMTVLVVTPPSATPKNPRSRSAGRPAKGAQCPRHKVGTYAYGQAQGSQAARPEATRRLEVTMASTTHLRQRCSLVSYVG